MLSTSAPTASPARPPVRIPACVKLAFTIRMSRTNKTRARGLMTRGPAIAQPSMRVSTAGKATKGSRLAPLPQIRRETAEKLSVGARATSITRQDLGSHVLTPALPPTQHDSGGGRDDQAGRA